MRRSKSGTIATRARTASTVRGMTDAITTVDQPSTRTGHLWISSTRGSARAPPAAPATLSTIVANSETPRVSRSTARVCMTGKSSTMAAARTATTSTATGRTQGVRSTSRPSRPSFPTRTSVARSSSRSFDLHPPVQPSPRLRLLATSTECSARNHNRRKATRRRVQTRTRAVRKGFQHRTRLRRMQSRSAHLRRSDRLVLAIRPNASASGPHPCPSKPRTHHRTRPSPPKAPKYPRGPRPRAHRTASRHQPCRPRHARWSRRRGVRSLLGVVRAPWAPSSSRR